MSHNMLELPTIQARFNVARVAVEAIGEALMFLRNKPISSRESSGGQLKTPVDKAAEAWILAYIFSHYPSDRILAEESFEEQGGVWDAPSAFWTVDALDGTRSFIGGFDGFCVQVAYIIDGTSVLGIIHEPIRQMTYWAIRGQGAYKELLNKKPQRLCIPVYTNWPIRPVFVDSTYPEGPIGQMLMHQNGKFLECGSIGLKICRVAEGDAHVFAKALIFKLWDVAPGQLLLDEAGGNLTLWDGSPIYYNTKQVYFDSLIVAPESLSPILLQDVSRLTNGKE